MNADGRSTIATGSLTPRAIIPWVTIGCAAAAAALLPTKFSAAGIGALIAILLSAAPPHLLLLGFFATAGINLQPGSDDFGGSTVGGLELNVARCLLLLATTAAVALRRKDWRSSLDGMGAYPLFLVFAGLSLLWAPDRIEGLRFLTQLSVPVAVYILARRAIQAGGVEFVCAALALSCGLGLLVNFAVSLTTGWTSEGGAFSRYYGTLAPNSLGIFSAIAALGAFVVARWRWRPLMLGLFFLLVVQMAATGSRTSLACLGIALIILQLLRRHWMSVVAIVLGGLVIWFLVPSLGARPGIEVAAGAGSAGAALGGEGNLSGRLFIWYDIWTSLISGAEWFGRGLGATTVFMTSRYSLLRSAHSEVIRLLAESGVVGLGLLAFAFITAGRGLLTRLRDDQEQHRDWARLGFCALLMLVLSSLTETALSGYMYFVMPVWVFIAMGMTPSAVSSREPHAP